jgi:hypothetical protein
MTERLNPEEVKMPFECVEKRIKTKWNPMTHSIYNGNLGMVQYLFANGQVNSKKIMKIPGLFSTSEVNKLFPFYVALHKDNIEMFEYFWTKHLDDT